MSCEYNISFKLDNAYAMPFSPTKDAFYGEASVVAANQLFAWQPVGLIVAQAQADVGNA